MEMSVDGTGETQTSASLSFRLTSGTVPVDEIQALFEKLVAQATRPAWVTVKV